ncbi:hypothetical protein ACFWGI_40200 [Streptomyces niveus]|uniref:hypothetical protein n=1 Tax=Streptomyces niveus TaxID=193462 RepID=UPI0036487CEA
MNELMAIIVSGATQRMIIATDAPPASGMGMPWHSGPRLRDIESLPADDPDRPTC